jgi:hypothetical protein
VRQALSAWEVSGAPASFRLVVESGEASGETPAAARVLRPARWWQAPLPALGKVAAALLLFAGGAAIANLEVRYDQDGFVVRTGWSRQDAPAPQPTPVGADARSVTAGYSDPSPWGADLASLERRLREDFSGSALPSAASAGGQNPALTEDVILRRVRDLIESSVSASEKRQQEQLAYRLREVTEELAAQRHNDLLRVQQGFGQIQGTTGAEVMQQRQLLNYLLTVSQRR